MTSQVTIRPVSADDVAEISALHARVFGPGRFARSAYRVRERPGDAGYSSFCRAAVSDGVIVAAVRMTDITIGGVAGAVLLGPLVVGPYVAGRGFGQELVAAAVEAARAAGRSLVLLVGDESYYGRAGFKSTTLGAITLPGPVDSRRMLAAELKSGALDLYRGAVAAA